MPPSSGQDVIGHRGFSLGGVRRGGRTAMKAEGGSRPAHPCPACSEGCIESFPQPQDGPGSRRQRRLRGNATEVEDFGRAHDRSCPSHTRSTAAIIVPPAPRGPSQSRHGHADEPHVTAVAGCAGRPDRAADRGPGARGSPRPAASAADEAGPRRRRAHDAGRSGMSRSPVGGVAAPAGGMSTSFRARIGRTVGGRRPIACDGRRLGRGR